LPLLTDIGSLLNVRGAAVVRAFAGDSGCCCDTCKDVAATSALALHWRHETAIAGLSPAAKQVKGGVQGIELP